MRWDRKEVTNTYRMPTMCQILCWARGRLGATQQAGAGFAKEISCPLRSLRVHQC